MSFSIFTDVTTKQQTNLQKLALEAQLWQPLMVIMLGILLSSDVFSMDHSQKMFQQDMDGLSKLHTQDRAPYGALLLSVQPLAAENRQCILKQWHSRSLYALFRRF